MMCFEFINFTFDIKAVMSSINTIQVGEYIATYAAAVKCSQLVTDINNMVHRDYIYRSRK